MKKLIIASALVASVGLVGCGINLNPNVASPNQIYIAVNAFDAAEATATNYLGLPLCPSAAVCRTTAASQAIVNAVRVGRVARDQLTVDLQTNVTAPITLLQSLTTAVSTLQSLAS